MSNHLTTILLSYFRATGRYESGFALFENLRARDPEVSSLLAKLYLLANEEVKAVELLHDSIKQYPMDYSLLDCQADFCNKKGRPDMAVAVAKRAVIASPSEFATWARLAEVYINSEQWDLALLTLNSCPMFTFQDNDAPRIPEPRKVVQPILPQSICPEVQDDVPEGETVPDGLRRLHGAALRGTFMKAYSLLTGICRRIGWDPLLQIRSQVFVMEEEYRNEKQVAQPYSSENTPVDGPRRAPEAPASDSGDDRSHQTGTLNTGDEPDKEGADDSTTGASVSESENDESKLFPAGNKLDRPPSAAPPDDKPRPGPEKVGNVFGYPPCPALNFN